MAGLLKKQYKERGDNTLADTKISGLTADTTPTSDDLIVTVNDPGGSPANRQVTLANLGSNGTWVDTGGVADDAITPAKLATGTGSDWAWQDWTPSYSNLTVNDGTVVAKYIQIGKTVHFRFSLVCGSSTALGDNMEVSLPVAAASGYGTSNIRMPIGNVVGKDGAATYFGVALTDASTTDLLVKWHADGANGFSGTFPFSEATSDSLNISGTYEAA